MKLATLHIVAVVLFLVAPISACSSEDTPPRLDVIDAGSVDVEKTEGPHTGRTDDMPVNIDTTLPLEASAEGGMGQDCSGSAE